MAVKHIKDYYLKVTNDYKEMLNELKEFEIDFQNKLVTPENLDRLKKIIEPIKNNFQILSYIIYLLNKPQRNDRNKQLKYEKQHKKDTQSIEDKYTQNGLIKQNKESLDMLKKFNI